jgi:hypothetical protein
MQFQLRYCHTTAGTNCNVVVWYEWRISHHHSVKSDNTNLAYSSCANAKQKDIGKVKSSDLVCFSGYTYTAFMKSLSILLFANHVLVTETWIMEFCCRVYSMVCFDKKFRYHRKLLCVTVMGITSKLKTKECRLLGYYACGSCENRFFGGTYRLLHQGDRNRWARSNDSSI